MTATYGGNVARRLLILVLIWAVVAVPASVVVWLNSSTSTVIAGHDVTVQPTLNGWATFDFGPYLPDFRYPTDSRVGANIQVGKTNLTSYDALLKTFWENHDPTQGMRQGNDVGTQYRSAIYVHSEAQRRAAEASRDAYTAALAGRGYGAPTTEIREAPPFYYAEEDHQQYLAKNPGGYCGLGGTGVSCPLPTGVAAR